MVIMVQVEGETGLLGADRDLSEVTTQMFAASLSIE